MVHCDSCHIYFERGRGVACYPAALVKKLACGTCYLTPGPNFVQTHQLWKTDHFLVRLTSVAVLPNSIIHLLRVTLAPFWRLSTERKQRMLFCVSCATWIHFLRCLRFDLNETMYPHGATDTEQHTLFTFSGYSPKWR